MTVADETETVIVYVRLGNDDTERRLRFRRPDISARTLLDHGFTIDGNQCDLTITAGELFTTERTIMAFLEEFGYEAEFK